MKNYYHPNYCWWRAIAGQLFGILFLIFPYFIKAQPPVQDIRGRVMSAHNMRPLPSVSLILNGYGKEQWTQSDESGIFVFEKVPAGRYRLKAEHIGYESLHMSEIIVEAGKETVLDILLQEQPLSVVPVVVKAEGPARSHLQPLSLFTVTVEEQLRFPASFFDPGRLVLAYPGLIGQNDGTNILSVRGNSPAALKWRLEGVEIVNPNHTANAGTLSDRPVQVGGGVNILSTQLLGVSHVLTGAFPAMYGNSTGGIFDMYLRKGNDRRHEFTAQAGFIGLDIAAEGPLSLKKTEKPDLSEKASYLVNYRYSFTGLLSAMGVDFGEEITRFQDLSFHLHLPSGKLGRFSLFGMGGRSNNQFRSPKDSILVSEDKQRFDIDFHSKMGALGLTHVLPVGTHSVLRSAVVLSGLKHERTADLVWRIYSSQGREQDLFDESKRAISIRFSNRLNSRNTLVTGIQWSKEEAGSYNFFLRDRSLFMNNRHMVGWLTQSFIQWHARLRKHWDLNAGLCVTHFSFSKEKPAPGPRLSFRFTPENGREFSLAYSMLHQVQQPEIISTIHPEEQRLARSQHLVIGYRQQWPGSMVLSTELYGIFQDRLATNGQPFISAFNLVESFLVPQHFNWRINGKAQMYGLDVALQQYFVKDYFLVASGSLWRSFYSTRAGDYQPSRFDNRYALNLSGGKEFNTQKENKTVTKGIHARLMWLGGAPAPVVLSEESLRQGFTVYGDSLGERSLAYWRCDIRLYIRKNRDRRSTLLSLDLQNVSNRRNFAFSYFDFVQGEVKTKHQLGLIPVLNWRRNFF